MTTTSNSTAYGRSVSDFDSEIRGTLHRLADLDSKTAGYLKILAFILHRVAMADNNHNRVSCGQRRGALVVTARRRGRVVLSSSDPTD